MKYRLIVKIILLLTYCWIAFNMPLSAQPTGSGEPEIIAVDDTITIQTPVEAINFIPIDILANDVLPDSAIVLVIPTNPEYGLAHWDDFAKEMLYVPFEFGDSTFIDQFDYTIHICYVSSSDTLFTNTATVTIVADCEDECVWPGDTNDSGRANIWDVLPIGLTYGAEGPERGVPNSLWIPQQSNEWGDSLELEGNEFLNYKYIDANGDGVIDSFDVEVIDQNYGFIHAKKGEGQLEDADFSIVLDFLSDSVGIGDTVVANIILSESGDTTDIYGLAFSINHNVEDSGSMEINFPPSFIGNQENTISLQKNLGNGRIEAAISRTNQQNTGGSGVFGVLTFIMEDFIDGKKKIASEEIVFDFLEVRAVNSRGEAIPITGVGDVAVFDDTSTGIEDKVIERELDFYPNPTYNQLNINIEGLQSTSVEITDLLGKRILLKSVNPSQKSLELSLKDLKQGVYLLQVKTKAGIIVKRVVVF